VVVNVVGKYSVLVVVIPSRYSVLVVVVVVEARYSVLVVVVEG
jgi:hypothetical protein